jgi:hypothetical protein
VGLGSTGTYTYCFFKWCPFKVVKKIIPFWICKIIRAHSLNTQNQFVNILRTQNESVHILRKGGLNLYMCREYAEMRLNFDGISQWVFAENAQWICSHIESMHNESVHILRIYRTILCAYWDYAGCMKGQISWRLWDQNRKYFRMFIRRPDGFVWPNHFKLKNFF